VNAIRVDGLTGLSGMVGGWVRWLQGPQAGIRMAIMAHDEDWLILDTPLNTALAAGTALILRQGCDHTLDTCSTRFGNAVNFRGEPYVPGNDLLTRYPTPNQ